ncbi:glycosyltransferase family 2 protein [Brachyspira sp. SAP_772]|uniref:glycosyltransferase family 2 protein n=1 Tax=Brachyspira sp. SAP_772 TaxID=2608385 RepID=UPI001E38D5AF|nr:glycosyltransferase family 2 protein [Brachyspira sp. SAP_772]
MDNIKVSVVIPVYNVEPYLRECLDSVINQTLKEIEIICIDDRSTDNSYQILEEYAKKDSRIRIFQNEKNSGAGKSRNKGINNSKGEYIGFIDSDDYISNDYFESLYYTAKKFNSDISNNINIYSDTNSKISYHYYNFNKISKLDIEYESETKIENINILSKDLITYAVWNKIFKKEFINKNKLSFIEDKIGSSEDADFIMRMIINNPKMSFNNLGKYYYRTRDNSSIDTSIKDVEYWNITIEQMQNTILYYKQNKIEYLDYIYIKTWNCPYYLFSLSNEINRKKCYQYLHDFALSIHIRKDLAILNIKEYLEYEEYLLIKNNDTYEKYLLQKQLFEQIKLLDSKINNIIEKQNSKIKLFGIDNFEDKKIIYIFGIKITLKNKK